MQRSFTGLSFDNLIKPLDPWNDLEDNYGKGAMKRFTNLKLKNPDLKTLVAIGGKFVRVLGEDECSQVCTTEVSLHRRGGLVLLQFLGA